jgi:glycosyltransferase involved in cell wall biosynthesis
MPERVDEMHQRLRVLLATNSVALGGMEKHVELLARDLDRSAAEVFAITPQWSATAPWSARMKQLADESAEITPDRRYGWLREWREALRFARQLREWRIDVVHLHLTTYEGGIWALLGARLAGVRAFVCTEHLAPEHTVLWSQRELRMLFTRGLDALICVSGYNRRAREAHLYTPAEKTHVVNNGIDAQALHCPTADEVGAVRVQLGIPAGVPVVGSAVRLVAEKGLEYLLEAMPRVLAEVPETRLLLVGDGDLRGALERLTETLGIRESVVFAGFQADPNPYIRMMDAFVLPVPFGSASIGLLEAMALERAAIITFGDKGEAVIDGETGLWAPPRNPAALAEAILRVVCDPAFRDRLGMNARRHILECYSSQRVASDLLALYERLAVR